MTLVPVGSLLLSVLLAAGVATAPAGGAPAAAGAQPGTAAGPASLTPDDRLEIERVCREMLEAWYGGDAAKMDRVLHQDLAKRGVLRDPRTGTVRLAFAGKEQMVEGARAGVGRIPQDQWNIRVTILDTAHDMATVRVLSEYLLDICQVARVNGAWQIVNVLWEVTKTPPWSTSRPATSGAAR